MILIVNNLFDVCSFLLLKLSTSLLQSSTNPKLLVLLRLAVLMPFAKSAMAQAPVLVSRSTTATPMLNVDLSA